MFKTMFFPHIVNALAILALATHFLSRPSAVAASEGKYIPKRARRAIHQHIFNKSYGNQLMHHLLKREAGLGLDHAAPQNRPKHSEKADDLNHKSPSISNLPVESMPTELVQNNNSNSKIQLHNEVGNGSISLNQNNGIVSLNRSLSQLNTAALLRGFYVFGGLGAVVVMYILVRTIRLRRKKTTVRKYGILTNREDLEMTPLGADDDEDTTIFEMNNHLVS